MRLMGGFTSRQRDSLDEQDQHYLDWIAHSATIQVVGVRPLPSLVSPEFERFEKAKAVHLNFTEWSRALPYNINF
jgi:hypothetical protein